MNNQAEILSIGSELTSGQNLDTNSQWLSRRLAEVGIAVGWHTTVADDLDANVAAFRIATERAGLVLATGGLGPTQDDLTREALARLRITEPSWGMPLQLWVQAARLGLRVREVGVPRLYLDPNRAFGGVLDDSEKRLTYYRGVIARAEAEFPPCAELPGILAACCGTVTGGPCS